MGLLIGRDGPPGLVSLVRLDKGCRVKNHTKGMLVLAISPVPNTEPSPPGKIHNNLWNDGTGVSL